MCTPHAQVTVPGFQELGLNHVLGTAEPFLHVWAVRTLVWPHVASCASQTCITRQSCAPQPTPARQVQLSRQIQPKDEPTRSGLPNTPIRMESCAEPCLAHCGLNCLISRPQGCPLRKHSLWSRHATRWHAWALPLLAKHQSSGSSLSSPSDDDPGHHARLSESQLKRVLQ